MPQMRIAELVMGVPPNIDLAAAVRPKRGRPRKSEAADRQNRFLDYCVATFMKSGYRNVSVGELATGFGVSKSTIYLRYGSKAGLVRAAIARATPRLIEPLESVATSVARHPVDVLGDFAAIISQFTDEPSIRALWQAVSEAREDLDDEDDIVEVETLRVLTPVTRYLRQLSATGVARIRDEQQAAHYFFEMVSGGFYRFLGRPLSAAQRARSNEAAVDFFCRAIGVDC